MIWLILCSFACLLDAITTNALVARGGYEKTSAWIIGEHPERWMVWGWVFTVPTVVNCYLWVTCPDLREWLVWVFAGGGIWRLQEAWHNHYLRR